MMRRLMGIAMEATLMNTLVHSPDVNILFVGK
jgi:hypothetical protein